MLARHSASSNKKPYVWFWEIINLATGIRQRWSAGIIRKTWRAFQLATWWLPWRLSPDPLLSFLLRVLFSASSCLPWSLVAASLINFCRHCQRTQIATGEIPRPTSRFFTVNSADSRLSAAAAALRCCQRALHMTKAAHRWWTHL